MIHIYLNNTKVDMTLFTPLLQICRKFGIEVHDNLNITIPGGGGAGTFLMEHMPKSIS